MFEQIADKAFFLWITVGVFLCILEFIVPGVFIVFLGLAAIFTGMILYYTGINFYMQLIVWAISSGLIIVAGAQFMKTLFPSNKKFEPTMDESVAGKLVKVVKKVSTEKGGRIMFNGTEWDAVSIDGEIEEGAQARILERKNLTFLVTNENE
ncbi:MAG: NfeD family protein [Leptospiraceae bacterium]|nr:NfeD family protein [Leptospiraceae bacterium]